MQAQKRNPLELSDMSDKKFKCPMLGCGREAKFIKFAFESVLMPFVMPMTDLQRKPPFGELMRNFLIECPQHGQRLVQALGHHVTTNFEEVQETQESRKKEGIASGG